MANAQQRAAFIVEVCNQYDALKRRADLVEQMAAALRKCALVCAGETITKGGLVDALESARAALSSWEAGQ